MDVFSTCVWPKKSLSSNVHLFIVKNWNLHTMLYFSDGKITQYQVIYMLFLMF